MALRISLYVLILLAVAVVHSVPVLLDTEYILPDDKPDMVLENGRRYVRAIDGDDTLGTNDLVPSEQRHRYRPYFKFRQISRRDFSLNRHPRPFSNYANSYDRFPTVA